MSKQGYFQRYFCIISNIKKHNALTFEKIQTKVYRLADEYIEEADIYIGFSKRTFQRDIKEIAHLFAIYIKYDRKRKAYYIDEETNENSISDRMIDILDIFNTVQMSHKTDGIIYLEPRQPTATYYMDVIIEAINKQQQLILQYQKFNDTHTSKRMIAPYAIKEFKNRWYLLGMEDGTQHLKSFAFDRISTLHILPNIYFQKNTAIQIAHLYHDCFGIVLPQQEKVQKVILQFDKFQKNYIKSLPLHHSQIIIEESEDFMQIALYIYITPDFITEILSFGEHVKVIKPTQLIQKVKLQLSDAMNQYDAS